MIGRKGNEMKDFRWTFITLKLVRSFGIGFTIYSPTLNGLCFDISIGCFIFAVSSKGRDGLIGFANYWNG